MRNTLFAFWLINVFCFLPHASAHYLWVAIDRQSGDNGVANIYFEEGPSAGDGRYLDHFTETNKTWFRTVKSIEPELVEPSDIRMDKKRWLQVKLAAAAPRTIDCYGKFGVYNYGKTKVLLHYYARNLDVASHEQLHELGRAEHMHLDIIPHDRGDNVQLTVRWKGDPVVDRMVYIQGPKKFRKNIETNENGRVRFTPVDAGTYTFRTSVEQTTAGREGEEDYDLIRHHATLVMTLPLNE